MLHLLGKIPLRVSATGATPVRWKKWGLESVAYVTVDLSDNVLAHFHVNWLSPVKVRRTIIGGSKKMIIYDPLDPDNEVKVYDKGVDVRGEDDRYQTLVQYRTGDIVMPKLDQTEALRNVCSEFINSIRIGRKPLTDGNSGLEVVRLLAAAQRSIQTGRTTEYAADRERAIA
jgi:predicted dehydrogenase